MTNIIKSGYDLPGKAFINKPLMAANGAAFAALKSDGSVVTWGDFDWGGDSSTVKAQLSGGVQCVFGNERAFAAVKFDGSVVTWGDAEAGGDSSSVASQLSGCAHSHVA